MKNKTENKQSEVKVKTSYRDGYEVIVIEQKQKPMKYSGMDV